jgi:hypothetical protein
MTITGVDSFGQVAIGYIGTVHFTSSDPQAMLPADYTFSASDYGMHTFTDRVTLETPGTQTVTAADTTKNVTGSATIIVNSPTTAVDSFKFTMVPPQVVAGRPFDVFVEAVDAQDQFVSAYTGTIHFASSDSQATLPTDYTFTAADNGFHTFANGVTLFTAGMQTLTVEDTSTNSIMGSTTIQVQAAPANHLGIIAPSTSVAGAPFSAVIEALDPYGNLNTGYTGTVTLTSSSRDPEPAVYTFTAGDGGTHTFNARVLTAGSQTFRPGTPPTAPFRAQRR